MSRQEGEGVFATIKEAIAFRYKNAAFDVSLKTKHWTFKKLAKRIAFYFILLLLTTAASVLLGILSWAGMWAIFPILAVAAIAGFLSVLFEGEIYFQNIKGALTKLFKGEYLKKFFANKHFDETVKNHKTAVQNLEETVKNHDQTGPNTFKSKFLKSYKDSLIQLQLIGEAIKKARTIGNKERRNAALKHLRQEEATFEKKRKTFSKLFTNIMFGKEALLTEEELQIRQDFYNTQSEKDPQALAAFKARSKHFNTKFLQDYEICLDQLKQVNANIHLAKKIEDRDKREQELRRLKQQRIHIEKNRKIFSKIFTRIMFITDSAKTPLTPYEKQLQKDFFGSQKNLSEGKSQEGFEALVKRRKIYYHIAKIWAFLSFAAVSFGTIYLMAGAIEMLPAAILLATPLLTSPFALIPIALIVGLAYGLLIYNAITDMINHETVQKWRKIFFGNELSYEQKWKRRLMFLAGAVLFSLAIALSVCTGGTWWTITQNAPAFLSWMNGLASGVLLFIRCAVAFITTIATGMFDVENTSETLDLAKEALKGKKGDLYKQWIIKKQGMRDQWDSETMLEKLNPFRIILMIVFVPLQILFFLGHLVSIGVDADRVFGIPEVLSAVLGTISEFFQDLHYFLKFMEGDAHSHADHQGHNHSLDLPTRFLFVLLSPLCLGAMLWAHCFRAKPKKEHAKPKFEATDGISEETQAELALFKLNRYDLKHGLAPVRKANGVTEEAPPSPMALLHDQLNKRTEQRTTEKLPSESKLEIELALEPEQQRLETMPNPWIELVDRYNNWTEQKEEPMAAEFTELPEPEIHEPVEPTQNANISALLKSTAEAAEQELAQGAEKTRNEAGFFCSRRAKNYNEKLAHKYAYMKNDLSEQIGASAVAVCG